ncbi:MAG: hypothetical protein HC917_09580, partial [Richelia sp. SM2_1_7]|nr:hypothetical protein [Richelia sp. SM2_1_7]
AVIEQLDSKLTLALAESNLVKACQGEEPDEKASDLEKYQFKNSMGFNDDKSTLPPSIVVAKLVI